ncbi:MAG TPA: zinc-dependent metalloprotease, partial [Roseiflexaceae bacterium]|nr:zinc-dependent metalloprotease [Roseiflexaceae bacterium]
SLVEGYSNHIMNAIGKEILPNFEEIERRIEERKGRHWMELVLTEEQRRIFNELQALMSLVEGYSNHIMNAIGEQLLPSFPQIEQRIHSRQKSRPLLEELFNRITGMDLKLAQYQQGEAFVNAVVEARGVAFVNQVWQRPENLPTMEEIRNPQQWIARMG